MIAGVGSVAVLVSDAKKSAEWYRDKLGFEIVCDKGHAVFVRPRTSTTPADSPARKMYDWGCDEPGGRVDVWLACGEVVFRTDGKTGMVIPASKPEDVEQTFRKLKGGGVEFAQELTATSWGKMAALKDPDGNEFEIS